MDLYRLDKIALRHLRCWVNRAGQPDLLQSKVLGFELGQIGFKIDNLEEFTSINRAEFESALTVLNEMRGSNVKYVPLFSRFPDDLPNDREYLIRRILGFFGLNTFGDRSKFGADPITQMQRDDLWQAAVEAQAARLSDSRTEWIVLSLASLSEVEKRLTHWATQLIYGVIPVKEALWDDIFAVIVQLNLDIDTEQIRVKETLARLAASQWQQSSQVIVKTPTDLLRMFACLQSQDVSLAKPVDLKGLKLSKPQRRAVIAFLNSCPALPEDLLRYKRLWISLSKWLHPGDFVKAFPRVASAFDDLRCDRIQSFEAQVINALVEERIAKLLERPSLLIRKLTWLLKDYPPDSIVSALRGLHEKVTTLPLPLLLTAYCALKYDGDRAAINKKGKAHTIEKRKTREDVSTILSELDSLILKKLHGSKNWETVWIAPEVYNLVLPLQARKQADGFLNLARGSRISVGSDTIRIFVYWQETTERTDLDLSAMQLAPDFAYQRHVSWNSYGSGDDITHSGDIQSAPLGAAEFIDLRLSFLEGGYILPTIIRFAGEKFSAVTACYAGWMNRQEIGSDTQTFDPKTAVEKVNVNQDGQCWIPFLLDVKAKEIIYVDLYIKGERTIENNKHFPALASALASYWRAKPTFGGLADWYARANNATFVARKDAKTTIGITDACTINVLRLVGEGVTSF